MSIPILTDSDVRPLLDMRELAPLMEEFLHAHAAGSAVTPPRHGVAFDPHGKLVFTIGGLHHQGRSLAGFRAYDTFETKGIVEDSQIVAVWTAAVARCWGWSWASRLANGVLGLLAG